MVEIGRCRKSFALLLFCGKKCCRRFPWTFIGSLTFQPFSDKLQSYRWHSKFLAFSHNRNFSIRNNKTPLNLIIRSYAYFTFIGLSNKMAAIFLLNPHSSFFTWFLWLKKRRCLLAAFERAIIYGTRQTIFHFCRFSLDRFIVCGSSSSSSFCRKGFKFLSMMKMKRKMDF